MDQGSEGAPTEQTNDPCEDTIELQLTGEQMLQIELAGEQSQVQARSLESTLNAPPRALTGDLSFGLSPAVQSRVTRLARRSDFICGLTLATAALIAGIALVVSRPADRSPPMAAITSPPSVISLPAPAPLAQPEKEPAVQVRNPFDATEVFEFPAGTSKTKAREAVAELLLERAQERRSRGVHRSLVLAAQTASKRVAQRSAADTKD